MCPPAPAVLPKGSGRIIPPECARTPNDLARDHPPGRGPFVFQRGYSATAGRVLAARLRLRSLNQMPTIEAS